MKKVKSFVLLHILLLVYSLGAVCSKMASQYPVMSVPFILFYGGVLIILFGYAILWQQIIKKMPLVTAYANKAVTVVWGLLWGLIVFKERISFFNIVGVIIIVVGIVLVVKSDEE